MLVLVHCRKTGDEGVAVHSEQGLPLAEYVTPLAELVHGDLVHDLQRVNGATRSGPIVALSPLPAVPAAAVSPSSSSSPSS